MDVSHSYLYFHFWQIYGKLSFVEYTLGANKIILTNGAVGSVVPVFKRLELLLENSKRFSETTVFDRISNIASRCTNRDVTP